MAHDLYEPYDREAGSIDHWPYSGLPHLRSGASEELHVLESPAKDAYEGGSVQLARGFPG
jgi:hypothetical protein